MARLVGPVSSYTNQYVRKYASSIAGMEKMYGREIKIAERGNQILVNSGVKTSVLDINKITSPNDLLALVQNNCAANEHAKNISAKFINWFKNLV